MLTRTDNGIFSKPGYGECDCCGKYRRLSCTTTSCGLETSACATCRGEDEEDSEDLHGWRDPDATIDLSTKARTQ